MTPVPEWRRVLLRAWSSRIIIVGGILSAGATAVSLIEGHAAKFVDSRRPHLFRGHLGSHYP